MSQISDASTSPSLLLVARPSNSDLTLFRCVGFWCRLPIDSSSVTGSSGVAPSFGAEQGGEEIASAGLEPSEELERALGGGR